MNTNTKILKLTILFSIAVDISNECREKMFLNNANSGNWITIIKNYDNNFCTSSTVNRVIIVHIIKNKYDDRMNIFILMKFSLGRRSKSKIF